MDKVIAMGVYGDKLECESMKIPISPVRSRLCPLKMLKGMVLWQFLLAPIKVDGAGLSSTRYKTRKTRWDFFPTG
jgi:hypothetical protein